MPRIGCYPDAIWDVDAALGRIIAALKKDERWEETLLVVTSDHGEGLGEHGLHHHGLDSYEEFVRIPMLVRGPGVKPGRFEMPVSLVDVAPTVVSAAGLQSPRSFQGHDLRQLQRGHERRLPVMSQMLITSVDGRPYRQQTLVVDGDVRHMWDRVTHRSWTFDIGDDPAQRHPKDGEAATVVKRWLDVFEAREADARPVVFPTTPLRR
jgi:arylsulfatase A-like enzyme